VSDLTIVLKVKGDRPLQVADAIIEFYVQRQDDIEMSMIDLEEFARYIFTTVEAGRQRLETIRRKVADSE
jgi:hypothetical protein